MTNSDKTGERIAVVTGGGQGIGAGVCRQLTAEGLLVVVADIQADKAITSESVTSW